MSRDFKPFITNHLYEEKFFSTALVERLPDPETATALLEKIKTLYSAKICGLSEAQLDHKVIGQALEALGWSILPEERYIIQEKQVQPDYTLFDSHISQQKHLALDGNQRKSSLNGIIAFCEMKAPDKELDTKKAKYSENPYFQLLEYLNYTRIGHGILTNGVEWRLIDNTTMSSEKKFISVQLKAIIDSDPLQNQDAFEAFRYFMFFFQRDTFISVESGSSAISDLAEQDNSARREVEEDLRKVIYGLDGKDSIFEQIGRALFESSDRNSDPRNLCIVFQNSLYLIFRLIFIAFFENKFEKQLDEHHGYSKFALNKIYKELEDKSKVGEFFGWASLKDLFKILNEGSIDHRIPLLNGGLFDNSKAELLTKSQVINDNLLKSILDKLFYYSEGEKQYRRDFRTLSITHIGALYEGLLEFEFRVAEEKLHYLVYRTKEKKNAPCIKQEGFFDRYDIELEKKKSCEVISDRSLPAGEIYLVNSKNSRKATGSYYTPSELSLPLIRQAIDHQLGKLDSIVKLRILDNACGSGHLLIEALNYLTRKAQERLEEDKSLRAALSSEMEKLKEEFTTLGIKIEIDEFDILKRLLLKQTIYGVDVQLFAVEVARLSLWLDTFVFGTPLSFIEHHIKVGNSLIGSTIAESKSFIVLAEGTLLSYEKLSKLHTINKKLSAISDITAKEVECSKTIYQDEIVPTLQRLNDNLNPLNCYSMLSCEGKKKEARSIKLFNQGDTELKYKIINNYNERYNFFNWELEFPEIFSGNSNKGFHVIIGNPPWDKTKCSDSDFFSQYRSNYRSLLESQKAKYKAELLSKPYISKKYYEEKARVKATNEYYKNKFRLNKGSGDGNLFRFFVERNLNLLRPGGTLNYILPTGFLIEEGSDNLRKHILEHYRIISFDGFENRKKIFPDIDQRYKYGLIQIERAKPDTKHASKMRFMLEDPSILKSDHGRFDYTVDDVKATSPEHMAFMEAGGGRKDLDLLRRFYGLFKPLSADWLDFRNELNATADKEIFLEQKTAGCLPLYKGAMIWQYNSRYADAEYWLDPEVFDNHLRDKEISRLISDVYPQLPTPKPSNQAQAVMKALGLSKRDELGKFIKPDRNYFRLGFRKIASDTNERTLVAAMVPKDIGAQDSLWLSIPKKYFWDRQQKIDTLEIAIERLLFTQAILNSLILDWIIRFSVGINVTKTYLMRLTLPQPEDSELASNNAYKELVYNSLLLNFYYNRQDVTELEERFKIDLKNIPCTKKQADMMRIRNDCLVAGLYKVTPEELSYLLKSFKVMTRKHPEYQQSLIEQYQVYYRNHAIA